MKKSKTVIINGRLYNMSTEEFNQYLRDNPIAYMNYVRRDWTKLSEQLEELRRYVESAGEIIITSRQR